MRVVDCPWESLEAFLLEAGSLDELFREGVPPPETQDTYVWNLAKTLATKQFPLGALGSPRGRP